MHGNAFLVQFPYHLMRLLSAQTSLTSILGQTGAKHIEDFDTQSVFSATLLSGMHCEGTAGDLTVIRKLGACLGRKAMMFQAGVYLCITEVPRARA